MGACNEVTVNRGEGCDSVAVVSTVRAVGNPRAGGGAIGRGDGGEDYEIKGEGYRELSRC